MNKEKLIKENEEMYGKEIREKYGDATINKAYKKISNMSDEQFIIADKLMKEMMDNLKKAYEINDPTCEYAIKAVELHKEWLSIFYDGYTKEYHLNLANMYVDDERFRKNYDVIGEGGTEFFREAIFNYHKNK